MFFRIFFTSFILFQSVLLLISFQRWGACFVISFGTTDGLDFTYLCSIPHGDSVIREILPCDRRELNLPNLLWHYWAAQLTTASCWFSQELPRSWMSMERKTSSPLPLNSCLYSAKLKELKSVTHNPFVKNTTLVWFEVHKYISEIPVLSQFTPIWGNSNFTPDKQNLGFKNWQTKA